MPVWVNLHVDVHCITTLQECMRKESEYSSNAVSFKDKYQSVCKQMSIKVSVSIDMYIIDVRVYHDCKAHSSTLTVDS